MTTQIVNPNAAVSQQGVPLQSQVVVQAPTEIISQPNTQLATQSKVLAAVNADAPLFMQQDNADFGTDLMQQYIQPPRLAIVQPPTPREVKMAVGGDSTMYCTPDNIVVTPANPECMKPDWSAERPFVRFTPLFFFPQYIAWNPRGVEGLSAVRGMTTDRESAIARRACSRNMNDWVEPCPEAPDPKNPGQFLQIRYQEHLNFIVLLYDCPALEGVPVLMSFSRTGHADGRKLVQDIKKLRAPCYGLMFNLSVGPRKNNRGEWFGFDINTAVNENGTVAFITDEGLYNYTKDQFLALKENYEAGNIKVDYSDDDKPEVVSSAPAAAAQPNRF